MKTLTDTTYTPSKTIHVEWTGKCFARYEMENGVPVFKHEFGWLLTKGSRAKAIFAALERYLDREYESKLFTEWVR